ncbi:hypothetical protein NE237_018929 [Protea cynaroides]|uniref:F-box domain-containing protein n=1 Tax=Protea cynaroides TaxID=273540 RepID=A0A9Q0QPH3_9MAGN|nr:hypothetical protein NE237_018929 [Protea cynaroides]
MANQKSCQIRRGIASDLPQELVREVLLRLPVKPLLRFKCVCKDWFTIISDPLFAKAQLQQVKPISGFICKSSKSGILSYFNLQKGEGEEIDFNVQELLWENVILQDSCNGLLLLQEHRYSQQFFVYNPIIKWHLKLPQFLTDYKIQNLWSSLVYDNSNHKYKVVITFKKLRKRVIDPVSYKCGVFTLGDKEGGGGGDGNDYGFWRVLDMTAAYMLVYCKPLSVNGALHWMTYIGTEVGGYILSMDIASEEFRVIRSPVHPILWPFGLLEMKGSLGLSYPVSYDQVDLWVLSDPVKQAWNKQISINYRILISESRLDRYFVFYPLVVMENPSPVIIFYYILKKELIFYNLDTGEFKVEHKRIGGSSMATVHVNSLIRG